MLMMKLKSLVKIHEILTIITMLEDLDHQEEWLPKVWFHSN